MTETKEKNKFQQTSYEVRLLQEESENKRHFQSKRVINQNLWEFANR